MDRLIWVITHKDHYYHYSKFWFIYFYWIWFENRDTTPAWNALYINTLILNCSICIGFRMYWQTSCARNERNLQRRYYHFFTLPNEMTDVTSWPVISHNFSWVHSRIACEFSREMIWSQNWDLTFKAKTSYSLSCGIRAASRLSINFKMILKWTTNTFWHTRQVHFNKRSLLDGEHHLRNTLWFMLITA
jgi:hypothetical protein